MEGFSGYSKTLYTSKNGHRKQHTEKHVTYYKSYIKNSSESKIDASCL